MKILLVILWSILIIELSILWNDKSSARKLFAGIMSSFLIMIFEGFIFSIFGLFKSFAIIIVLFFEDCVVGTYLYISKKWELKWLKHIEMNPLVIIMVLIAMQLLLGFPSTTMYGGRDEGGYFVQGVHIAETGKLSHDEDDAFLDNNYEKIAGWCELGYLGFYSKYNFGTSSNYGSYEFQFMPLFPVALAYGYLLGELPLLIRVNGILGILSLLCVYFFVRDFLGNKYHALLSCYFILLSPAFLWNARATFSETMTQCLFFCCIYLFAKGWNIGKIWYAFLAGLVVGLALLTRIDVFVWGFGILAVNIWTSVFDKKKKRYVFIFSGTYVISSLLVILYGIKYNYSYLYEHWTLLRLLILMHVLMFAVIVFTNFIFKNKKIKNFLLNKKCQNVIIIFYWIIILFLLFIRPRIDGYDTAKEFTWYTSVIAVLCVPVGIKCILNRNRDKVNLLMLFFLIAGSGFFLYIINPSISPDHIWMSRRWVVLGIPFTMICFANMLNFYGSWIEGTFNTIITIFVTGYLLIQDRPFIAARILDGLDNQYQNIADQLEDDKVYYTSSTWLASTLRFVYDENVYYIDDGTWGHLMRNGKTQDVENELIVYLQKENDCIYYIGPDNFTDERLHVSIISQNVISGEDLERTTICFPQKLYQLNITANIYEITVNG